MNSKGHFIISLMKSILRIGSCIAAFIRKSVVLLAAGLFLAECLGIIEEVVDKR